MDVGVWLTLKTFVHCLISIGSILFSFVRGEAK